MLLPSMVVQMRKWNLSVYIIPALKFVYVVSLPVYRDAEKPILAQQMRNRFRRV